MDDKEKVEPVEKPKACSEEIDLNWGSHSNRLKSGKQFENRSMSLEEMSFEVEVESEMGRLPIDAPEIEDVSEAEMERTDDVEVSKPENKKHDLKINEEPDGDSEKDEVLSKSKVKFPS